MNDLFRDGCCNDYFSRRYVSNPVPDFFRNIQVFSLLQKNRIFGRKKPLPILREAFFRLVEPFP